MKRKSLLRGTHCIFKQSLKFRIFINPSSIAQGLGMIYFSEIVNKRLIVILYTVLGH